MYSGFDTDKMVKDMLQSDQNKIDLVNQNKTYAEWEQEAYRSIIKSANAIMDEHFDVLNPSKNLTSGTSFAKFSSTAQINGVDTSFVSVTGSSSIQTFSHTISSITQLATKDTWTTDAKSLSDIDTSVLDFGTDPGTLQFSLSIDNNAKTISIDTSTMTTATELRDALNTAISTEFGSEFSDVVSESGGQLKFSKPGNHIKIIESTGFEAGLTWMGVTSGDSTTSYKNESINTLFSITDADLATMTINGTSLSSMGITQDSSVSQLSTLISESTVGADFSYDELTDKFTLKADQEGVVNNLDLSNDFLTKLGFSDDVAHRTEGQNAIINLDGVSVSKTSNTFSVSGVTYELKNTYDGSSGDIDINLSTDTDAIIENIQSFVDLYNGLITDVNSKLTEKKYYDYKPLTTEQKADLSEDDIKAWEAKAMSGILRGSSELESMLTRMRQSLYAEVDGVGVNIFDIGITTSKDHKEYGKLVIDETKLKESLQTNYEEVVQLFTNKSDKAYNDGDNADERYNENGIASRIEDIFKDSVRLTRNDSGYKGTLIEKAGIDGDVSNETNMLTQLINDYDKKVESLQELYADRETSYYIMFGKMESALAEMQAQSSSLLSSLGM